jgi:acetolactate synthase regulatory subunit
MSAALRLSPNLVGSTTRDERFPDCTTHTVLLSDGLTGVNRVVSLLRQRGYVVYSLTAEIAARDNGETKLTVAVVASSERDAGVLAQRLLRLPSVLAVRTRSLGHFST